MNGRKLIPPCLRLACALALAGLSGFKAAAQEPEFRTGAASPAPVSATEGLSRLPQDAYPGEPAVGIPQRTLFRDTGAPYLHSLRTPALEPSVRPTESIDATFHLDMPDVRGDFPLLARGFEPEDADLKLGPVYFKLKAFGLGLLASDNIELSEDDRESDVIGIVRLSGTIIVQLT